MPYAHFRFQDAPPVFDLGATTVFVANCPWLGDPISEPILLGGRAPGAVAADAMRQLAPVARLHKLELGRMDSGMEVLEAPATLIDAAGRVQTLKHIQISVNESEESIGTHIGACSTCSEDGLSTAVKTLVRQHPRLRPFISPYSLGTKLLSEAAPLISIGRQLNGDTSKESLTRALSNQINSAEQEVRGDAELLQKQMSDCSESLAALAGYNANVRGSLGKALLLITRDVNELLENHREKLVDRLAQIKGSPFIDLVFANFIEADANHLHAFADDLVSQRRMSIWATFADGVHERDAVRIQQANPKRGTFGAAALCLYVGRARHRGYEVPVSALVAAGRLHRDQDGAASMLDPHWGPQPSKTILGIDGVTTLPWSDKVIESLAMNSGINAIREHETGVRSPMFGRTPSTLKTYSFIDSNRVGALLSGNIVAWLGQVIPGTLNTPAMQRVWCDKAAETFLAPFGGVDGFHGEIKPSGATQATAFNILLRLLMADQCEKIVVRYEQ
ncbi:MAG: hypothetical protein K2X38_16500 [Gemmataceae bacterium]|nr:hypothetical protein [Gemmataceae bacterium]